MSIYCIQANCIKTWRALQVDLKDKWRNLERQGVVGPADAGPAPPSNGIALAAQAADAVMAQDRQQGLDVQHLEHQQQLAQQQLQQQQHQHMLEQQHVHAHHQHQQHMMEQHAAQQQQHMGHEQAQPGDGSEMLAMEGGHGHDMGGLPGGVPAPQVNIPVNM